MPFSAGTAPKTAKYIITMNSYTLNKDEQHKIPDDARNLRQERVRGELKIRFQSDTGPIDDDNECSCQQCDAEQDATPDNLTPRRKTPEGWN